MEKAGVMCVYGFENACVCCVLGNLRRMEVRFSLSWHSMLMLCYVSFNDFKTTSSK